jgi:hypothetical protein
MSATTDDIIELLRRSTALPAGPFDVTQSRVEGGPYISGEVKGRTQDNFGRFNAMDTFAYDQELQGRDNFGGTWRGFIDEQDVLNYFNTPGLTPQAAAQYLQTYGVEPEEVASILGLTPEAARAQYTAALAPFAPATAPVTTTPAATAPVTTPPATTPSADDAGVLDLLRTGATRVGEFIDKALIGFGNLIGGFDPRLVVLNPVSQSGTVVFGNPSGNTTPTIIGNMPTSKAPIGVVTGNPTLDAILSKVFSKNPPGQSSPNMGEIIRQAVLDAVGEATGVNAGAVASAAQGDVGGLIDAATKVVVGVNKNVAETDEKYKTQDEIDRAAIGTDQVADLLEREPTNVDVTDPFPLEPGSTTTGSETDDIIRLLGDSTTVGPIQPIRVVNSDGTLLDPNAPISGPIRTTTTVTDDTTKKVVDDTTVTDDTTKKVVDDTTVTDDTTKKVVDDTTIVEEDVPPKVVSPDGPVTPPKTVTNTPIQQPQSTQNMYSVGTEKAGVADIGTPYDLNASLLDNIMRILAEKEAGAEETELYGGGSVNGYNATDELIKLLRG